MKQIAIHCSAVFIPEKNVFAFAVSAGTKAIKLELEPREYIAMARYFAEVGVSYQNAQKLKDAAGN